MVALAKNAAFLGLQPSTNPKNYAYLGLMADISSTPAIPQTGGSRRYRNLGTHKPEIPVPSKNRQEIEEELILMYYHNNFFWE